MTFRCDALYLVRQGSRSFDFQTIHFVLSAPSLASPLGGPSEVNT
jgi:hypothetical protein